MKWLVILIVFLFVISPTAVLAQNSNNKVVLPKSELVNHDYFAAGGEVTLSGTVNGDAYLTGGNIYVDGVVNGDLLVAGGNVIIVGQVKNNIRVAGGSITISGPVGGNVSAAGGSTTISNSAKIAGSLAAVGGQISIYGPVGKGISITGGQATLGNLIGSDTWAGVGKLSLNSEASISGNLTYVSKNNADIAPSATVSGQLIHNYPPSKDLNGRQFKEAISGLARGLQTLSLIASLLLGLLIIRLSPNYVKTTSSLILTTPLKVFLFGVLTMILTPVLLLALLFTIIGIPFAILLLFIFLILYYFSKIFVAIALGDKLLVWVNQRANPYLSFVIGFLVLVLFIELPVVGFLVSPVVVCIGLGALVLSLHKLYSQLRDKKAI